MNIEIGARIRQLRLEKSLTQEQLAQRLGLSAQAVSKWENGLSMPDIQLLPKLSVLLGTTIDGLFTMTDDARFDRIDRMLEDVRFMDDEEFGQTLRWLSGKRQEPEARPRATLLLAELLNKRADEYHELAAPLAREALSLLPDSKDAHLAVFNAQNGVCTDWNCANHHKLIDYYKGVVEARPEDWHNYMWLLDLLVADRRVEEGRAYVERLRGAWDNWRCELYLAQLCLAACDLPGALEWYRKMLDRAPEDCIAWAAYGDEMAKQCRWDEALEAHAKAMALSAPPRYVDSEETVAGICEIRGDCAAAIAAQRRILGILREDWGITEGEGVDAHLREIERLEAKLRKG